MGFPELIDPFDTKESDIEKSLVELIDSTDNKELIVSIMNVIEVLRGFKASRRYTTCDMIEFADWIRDGNYVSNESTVNVWEKMKEMK